MDEIQREEGGREKEEGEPMSRIRKCGLCGREGYVPSVRGAKSLAVSIGNFRAMRSIDVEICEECANRIMDEALSGMLPNVDGGEGR